jgi:predicted RNA-binding Zn ribbon-like protein
VGDPQKPQQATAIRPDNDPVGSAPIPLRWIEEFVNTRRADRDEIATPAALTEWLHERGLLPAAVTMDEGQRDRAETLREGLRALLADNNVEPVASPRPDGLDGEARTRFAELVPRLPLVLDLTTSPPRLAASNSDPGDAALATLLGFVADSVAAGTWNRMKTCREPSCRWAFYDHSRNRRRTWCSMDLCGNRVKARSSYLRKTTA